MRALNYQNKVISEENGGYKSIWDDIFDYLKRENLNINKWQERKKKNAKLKNSLAPTFETLGAHLRFDLCILN